MALFYAAIKRDSVSLFRFPFRSHVQVFSCEISPVCRLKYPYSCFFLPFLFPCYCCSICLYVAIAATGDFSLLFLM